MAAASVLRRGLMVARNWAFPRWRTSLNQSRGENPLPRVSSRTLSGKMPRSLQNTRRLRSYFA
jgi:hypothetical protein